MADLIQTTYKDFNDTHLTEKLYAVDTLPLSRESVRRIRRALGLPAKHRRRPRRHRSRRTPEAHMGRLVQIDGSPFDWLEGRGPAMTLLGAIDDATGQVVALHFRPTEDLHGYTVLLAELCTHYGRPLALYGDRLNVFVRNDRHWSLEEQLAGAQHPTHFGRMLQELGIGYIAAGSPEAKGRIERLWRTLQDRLTSELRLGGITTREAANAFLPEFLPDFNARFAHESADPTPAWRPAPKDLALVLSCRYQRTVARDNTVRLGARWIQIPPGPRRRSYAGCRVELRERLDGRLVVLHAGVVLATQPAPGPDFTLKPRRAPSTDRRRAPRAPLEPPSHSVGPADPTNTPPQLALQPRSPLDPRSEYPRKHAAAPSANGLLAPPPLPPAAFASPPRRSNRPTARHPWRRPFSRRASSLTPTGG